MTLNVNSLNTYQNHNMTAPYFLVFSMIKVGDKLKCMMCYEQEKTFFKRRYEHDANSAHFSNRRLAVTLK